MDKFNKAVVLCDSKAVVKAIASANTTITRMLQNYLIFGGSGQRNYVPIDTFHCNIVGDKLTDTL